MKKLLFMAVCLLMLVTSCMTAGDSKDYNDVIIRFHKTDYKVKWVTVQGGLNGQGIYIMYPLDSTKEVPMVINFPVQEGKVTVNKAVVTLK